MVDVNSHKGGCPVQLIYTLTCPSRLYIIKKCPYLIQEMVNCISQLILLAHAGRIGRVGDLAGVPSGQNFYELPELGLEGGFGCSSDQRHHRKCSDRDERDRKR